MTLLRWLYFLLVYVFLANTSVQRLQPKALNYLITFPNHSKFVPALFILLIVIAFLIKKYHNPISDLLTSVDVYLYIQ